MGAEDSAGGEVSGGSAGAAGADADATDGAAGKGDAMGQGLVESQGGERKLRM